MKKLLVILLGVTCAMVLSANAAEGEKSDKSDKSERKALIEKYDSNKDGKLDKDEQAKMSTEDKEKWAKVKGGKKKKDEAAKENKQQ